MPFNWKKCDECGRKYQNEDKHFDKYHNDSMVKQSLIIPFEYYPDVRMLLKKSKLQVVKQKPELLVKVAPFIHHSVEIDDDIIFEIGKTYIIKETE